MAVSFALQELIVRIGNTCQGWLQNAYWNGGKLSIKKYYMKRVIQGFRDTTKVRKRTRVAITVSKLEAHLCTTEDCFALAREIEDKQKVSKPSKKGKGKDKGVYSDENKCYDGFLIASRDDNYQIDDSNAFMNA